jgi:hypothetical protein
LLSYFLVYELYRLHAAPDPEVRVLLPDEVLAAEEVLAALL